MTEQEEIREGVARIGVGGINPLENARPNEHGYEIADNTLAYLHLKNVVRLTEASRDEKGRITGFRGIESLIKEE